LKHARQRTNTAAGLKTKKMVTEAHADAKSKKWLKEAFAGTKPSRKHKTVKKIVKRSICWHRAKQKASNGGNDCAPDCTHPDPTKKNWLCWTAQAAEIEHSS